MRKIVSIYFLTLLLSISALYIRADEQEGIRFRQLVSNLTLVNMESQYTSTIIPGQNDLRLFPNESWQPLDTSLVGNGTFIPAAAYGNIYYYYKINYTDGSSIVGNETHLTYEEIVSKSNNEILNITFQYSYAAALNVSYKLDTIDGVDLKAPEQILGRVPFSYIALEGNNVSFSGDTYNIDTDFDGYDVIGVEGELQGVFAVGEQNIVIVYQEQPLSAKEGTVIAKYVDEDGAVIADDVLATGEVGTVYTTEPKEIDGYTLLKVDGYPTGDYTEEDILVVYIYQKKTDPIPIKEGKVIAKHVDENGTVIADEVLATGEVGTAYTTEPKEIDGYTLLKVDGYSFGDHTEEDIIVIYIYQKKTDSLNPGNTDNHEIPSAPENTGIPQSPDPTLPNTGMTNSAIPASVFIIALGMLLILIANKKRESN